MQLLDHMTLDQAPDQDPERYYNQRIGIMAYATETKLLTKFTGVREEAKKGENRSTSRSRTSLWTSTWILSGMPAIAQRSL